jgi:hypothetical protein
MGAASLVIAWAYAGGGHGTYTAAKILFPYTMYFAASIVGKISAPLLVLALLEFPAYGFTIGLAAKRGRMKVALALVLAVHTAASGLCFSVKNADFAGPHLVKGGQKDTSRVPCPSTLRKAG